jgi:hypothetical protein
MYEPRPTRYNGVLYRSRLESRVARFFDLHGVTHEYEPTCFADATGEYLPDFLVKNPPCGFDCYVEVKHSARLVRTAALRMGPIRMEDPTVGLVVIVPVGDYLDDPQFEIHAARAPGRPWEFYAMPVYGRLVDQSPWADCRCARCQGLAA